jgi:P-loop Nucleotide Kinase3
VNLVYLVGLPGVGKTTVMGELLERLCVARRQLTLPVAHEVLLDEPGRIVGAHLGIPRGAYGGTDALGENVLPEAAAWLATRPYPLVLGEGERLASGAFFAALAAAGIDPQVVELVCDAATLQRRIGGGASPARLAGPAGKLRALAGWVRWRVDATGPPGAVADELITHLELPAPATAPP